MAEKRKNIEVVNIGRTPEEMAERRAKAQREEELLQLAIKDLEKREIAKKRKAMAERKRRIKKGKKRAAVILVGATVIGMGGCALSHMKNEPKEIKENVESALEKEENTTVISEEQEKIETDNLLAFLKDAYIENHEEITGDTALTTADIQIMSSYEDYVFVNNQTGEITTHGLTPDITQQKLMQMGISYHEEHDVKTYKVYRVQGEEKQEIDCIMIRNGEPTKVTLGDNVGEETKSALYEMGSLIPDGLDCIEFMERKDENSISKSKVKFMKTLEQYKKMRESKQMEDDFELE